MLEIIAVLVSLAVIHYKYRDAMVDLLQNLQAVYSKWEDRSKASLSYLPQADSVLTKLPSGDERHSGGSGDHANQIDNSIKKRNGFNGAFRSQNSERIVRPYGQGERSSHSFRNRHLRYDRNRIPALNLPRSAVLGAFKTEPTIFPNMAGLRPFMGSCCNKCLPTSRRSDDVNRKSLVDDAVLMLGMNNILLVPTMNEENGYIVRRFHYLIHVLRIKQPFTYTNVSGDIPDHEKVVNAVKQAAMEDAEECDVPSEAYSHLVRKHTKRAKQLLRIMKSNISKLLIRIVSWTVYKVLSKLLISVQVNKGQIEILRRASELPYPLIFLPTHRSHLDYILVTFILVINQIRAPLVASGDNMRIPIIGSLLKGLGAFFIKRKLDPKAGKKDHVYRAVLHTYMEKSLAAGHNLEFFMEGGRSRTGKTNIPKAGLLSVVMHAFMDNHIEDAYIVPITINYDKLMDGNFVSEQLGNPKVMESLWSTIKAMWRLGNSNYGSVRIDFAQPFSLKEFVQSAQTYTVPRHIMGSVPAAPSTSPRDLRRLSSSTSLYGTDVVVEDQRHLVKALAEHVSYDLSNSMSVMSTNLLAFLLLTKFRQGATFQQAVNGFTWLREELRVRGRDVGFTGDSAVCVEYALNLLGPDLIARTSLDTIIDVNSPRSVVLKAATDLPHVVEVSYYSNAVVTVFLMESVIANALYAILNEDLATLRDCDSRVTVSRQQLVEKAETLCDILQFEFIFVPPCMNLTNAIIDTVEKFIGSELLSTIGGPVVTNTEDKREQEWVNRFAKTILLDSDSDDEDDGFRDERLKVNLTEENVEQLEFFRNILSPYIESYWLTACNLTCLVQTQMEESDFLKHTRLSICTRIASGLLLFNESVSADSLRNSIKLFENWKVVESCAHDRVRLLYLADEYNREDQIADVVAAIEEFKK